jgi:hypothetical protein
MSATVDGGRIQRCTTKSQAFSKVAYKFKLRAWALR